MARVLIPVVFWVNQNFFYFRRFFGFFNFKRCWSFRLIGGQKSNRVDVSDALAASQLELGLVEEHSETSSTVSSLLFRNFLDQVPRSTQHLSGVVEIAQAKVSFAEEKQRVEVNL